MFTCQRAPFETLQLPGEVMFVPDGWYHAVINLLPTVAVSVQLGTNKRMVPGFRQKKKKRKRRTKLEPKSEL